MLALLIGCGGTEAPDAGPDDAPRLAPTRGEDLPAPTEAKLAASHVLVTWSGAATAPVSVTRTQDEALALARQVHAEATSGADFDALASANSDGPSAARGGTLGVWQVGTMIPGFERCTAAAEIGTIAPLCETAFGYHIIVREPVIEARARHVLITWKGAWRSAATRTKPEAHSRIQQAATALGQGTTFEEVAREYGEDATAHQGGDLGMIAPGQLVPSFEEVLFALAPGEISDVVETPYGYHLIRREP